MAARSGQITVTTAGTAVQGPSTPTGTDWYIRGHPDNTDVVWVGNDGAGDVSSSNGFALASDHGIYLRTIRSLDELWFDADVSGEKLCWFAA